MNPNKTNPRSRNDIAWMNKHLQKDLNGAMQFNSDGRLRIVNAYRVIDKLNLTSYLNPEELVDSIVEYLNKRFPGQNFRHERNRR